MLVTLLLEHHVTSTLSPGIAFLGKVVYIFFGYGMMEFISPLIMRVGSMFIDPSERVYWGAWLGSFGLILLLSGKNRWHHCRILLSPSIWFHRSSLADIQVIVVNGILRTTLLPLSVFSAQALAAGISVILTGIVGKKMLWDLPSPLLIGLCSVSFFLLDDFARFFLHYLQHSLKCLWVFHQTHHSALVLTPLTLFRSHPVDILLAHFRNTLVLASVTGLWYFLFNKPADFWDIFGVQALGFTFNFAGANLRHSQVFMTFGRFDKYLISPGAHQIHHSSDPQHYNKNFGVCLAIWDRLWSTHWIPSQTDKDLRFGLVDSPMSDDRQRLWPLYWQSFIDLKTLWLH